MTGLEPVQFGRYEVLRPIGDGGMAQVYLCVRRGAGGFERRVVLKVLHSRFIGHDDVVEMFLQEARLLARMNHQNIVGVFEVECIDGVPYLAMEYVQGPTLGQLQRHVGRPGPDTLGYFLHVIRQVCDGLHHAHTLTVGGQPAGVVHRDVSSQNIVIDAASGCAKLIDFGIAKALDADHHTHIGILKGRLHYIAPEVLDGARPDARADLYAVGVLLHRLSFGRMPYHESELVGKRAPIALPADELRGFPDGLAETIVRALSANPQDRHDSAAELGAELQGVVDVMRIHQGQVAVFVGRVFPRGEEDWQRSQEAPGNTLHTSLQRLASEVSEPAIPQGTGASLMLILGASVVLALSAFATAVLVIAASVVSR